MDALEGLRLSWRNVRDHPLRSTLTTLGVIIGVATVITFVTLGASLQADIVRSIAGDNTRVMYASTDSESGGGLPSLGRGGQAVFTEHDVDRIRRLEGVSTVVPEGGFAAALVSHGNDSVGRQWVTATTAGYFDITDHAFVAGRPFVDGRREVVMNEQAARMFATNVSVGDRITITRAANRQQLNATVVGIVTDPGGGEESFVGRSRPRIFAPTDPFYKRTVVSPAANEQQRVYGRVLIEAASVERVETVQGRVLTYLAEESDARRLKPASYRFAVVTHDQLVDQIRDVSRTFTAYITGIALISLVVGAIGIANIMLVSVTERTREIGIMKAIGARRRDIVELFLVESVLLGALGAVLGAVVGLGGGYLATAIIDLPFQVRPRWFVIAVLAGVLVGVLAGIYPAWDAARTDPIDALRHE